MFEKEAEERAERKISNFIPQQWGVILIRTEQTYETVEGAPHFYLRSLAKMWKEGAEFGFNKANEWHDLRKNPNDLPPKELEEKQLLIRVRGYEDFIIAYYMLDKYYSKNGKRFFSDIDCDFPIDTEDIIDWKEIIPSKEM